MAATVQRKWGFWMLISGLLFKLLPKDFAQQRQRSNRFHVSTYRKHSTGRQEVKLVATAITTFKHKRHKYIWKYRDSYFLFHIASWSLAMDKLRRVLSGQDDNEELGLTDQVTLAYLLYDSCMSLLMLTSCNVNWTKLIKKDHCATFVSCLKLSYRPLTCYNQKSCVVT